MAYDQKTQEISLDTLDEVLSDVEIEEYVFESALDSAFDSAFELEPIEPVEALVEHRSNPLIAGTGVYHVSHKRTVKPAVANAAVRHLRRAHTLLKRLESDCMLLSDEKKTLEELEAFLIRNALLG
ncbi:MAG: hypothetical protein H0U74_20105 [Bradymonadaceae bacterium]|nr:hypothetical protein [Lujinxingiaceae bacterium]